MFEGLPFKAGQVTRLYSPENPTGAKGMAARWDPADPSLPHGYYARRLGVGWKVHPFISIEAGETAVLADIHGSGEICYFFIGTSAKYLSELVLRMYWNGEQTPSVECPLGAFFAQGFDLIPHEVTSAMVVVAPKRGMNCYWPMPFSSGAKITLTNEGDEKTRVVAYKFAVVEKPVAEDTATFHAQFRRSWTSEDHPEHILLDGVRGVGAYVGTYLAWQPTSTGWWGEGEMKFFIDGDREFPSIADTGLEDYFGGAWNYGATGSYGDVPDMRPEQVYNAPFTGLPLAQADNFNAPRKYGMYRWHVPDAIGFKEDLRVTVQAMAWYPDNTYRPSHDEVTSVAYWYQKEPHVPFPTLPPREKRWDR